MGDKLNVVDSENNLVGFDLADDCCAHGGYVISPTLFEKDVEDQAGMLETDFPAYVFDTQFFKDCTNSDGAGGAVVFKMTPRYSWNDGDGKKPDLYLHLYNVHNGYYSKGFKASFDGVIKGSI